MSFALPFVSYTFGSFPNTTKESSSKSNSRPKTFRKMPSKDEHKRTKGRLADSDEQTFIQPRGWPHAKYTTSDGVTHELWGLPATEYLEAKKKGREWDEAGFLGRQFGSNISNL